MTSIRPTATRTPCWSTGLPWTSGGDSRESNFVRERLNSDLESAARIEIELGARFADNSRLESPEIPTRSPSPAPAGFKVTQVCDLSGGKPAAPSEKTHLARLEVPRIQGPLRALNVRHLRATQVLGRSGGLKLEAGRSLPAAVSFPAWDMRLVV